MGVEDTAGVSLYTYVLRVSRSAREMRESRKFLAGILTFSVMQNLGERLA